MKNKEIFKTSFDLTAETIRAADAIARDAKLASRKDAVEKSIKFCGQVVEALKQGLRIMAVDADGNKKEFNLDVPLVEPQAAERLIVSRLTDRDVTRLLVISSTPNHPAANVALRLVVAASHRQGFQTFPASLLFQLIYLALRLPDDEFLAMVRDVVTTSVTACDSFADLLNLSNEIPGFDVNFPEQRFLSDEYHQEKRKQLAR
jgi:hypothetical protein